MEFLDYAGHAYPVEGLGPGQRVVIWVRGCRRRCPGCMTPELWHTGEQTPVAAIAEELLPLLQSADGLTISGGEPFEQPAALCALLDILHASQDVEVLVYTGYVKAELSAGNEAAQALLKRLDLLVDGPYLEAMPNQLQWRGSDNQQVHLLSERAQRYAREVAAPMPVQRPLQVQMLSAGICRIIGIPRRGDVELLVASCGLRVAG